MAKLGYKTLGSGKHKVMVLHGWFGDQTLFDTMENALDLARFTYVLPAYRGYGASKSLQGEYSMAEIAEDVVALADDLGWKTFSLIGHSMGGMAIQRVLVAVPERIDKMVAIAPVPASGMPLDADAQALFGGASETMANRSAIIDFTTGSRLSPVWVNNMTQYSAETSHKEAFHAYLSAWAQTDFHADIVGNPVPIKVIIGANDPAMSADVMRATFLAWYPNAELEIMENAGHYPMNEVPIALTGSMEAFLRS